MDNPNCWRQPTPTDIRSNKNIDLLSRLIFYDILNGCQNKPYHKVYYHGNKRIDLDLDRGQYLFVVARYAKAIHVSRTRIKKHLEIVSKWYNEMHIESKGYGLIVTVLNYDELTEMHIEKNIERTSKEHRKNIERTSNNKSVKNIKIDKTFKRREKHSTFEGINDEVIFQEIADRNEVPISFVKSKYEDLGDYCDSTGKVYKNYLATLRNLVKRDAQKLRKDHYYASSKERRNIAVLN